MLRMPQNAQRISLLWLVPQDKHGLANMRILPFVMLGGQFFGTSVWLTFVGWAEFVTSELEDCVK